MCGRYATTRTPDELSYDFAARLADGLEDVEGDWPEPDWNMAPTKRAPIIVDRPDRGDRPGGRQLIVAQWGLVPSWAKDPKIGSRMINARSETVAEKPSFAKAFASRRAVVPADGFYEWYPGREPDGSLNRVAPERDAARLSSRGGRGAAAGATHRRAASKQPFYIAPKDGSVLAMAGLFEFWKASPDIDWLITFTILTTSAADDLGHLHDRAPMMLVGDQIDAWLDPTPMTPDERLDLLVPAVPGRLDAWPVSTAVNNHRNNGPQLIEPIPAE